MAAKDYKLCISPLTGTVYIAKVSKRKADEMTDERVVVDKSTFIDVLLQWTEQQLRDNEDSLSITEDGQVIAEIIIKR